MKNCCPTCKPMMKDLGLLLMRLVVGGIFIFHGWGKLADMDATIGFFTQLNFPAAAFLAYLVAIVELLGGVGVLLGVFTKMCATLLAVVMLVALLTVHWGDFMASQLPLTLLGANLALMGVGAGKWALWKDCMCCDEK